MIVAPGGTIGILGGGQLGRMIAMAAAQLGYRCHVFAPETELPAADVAAAVTHAGYDDGAALDAFAASVDVVTLEFENVAPAALRRLAARVPVRPGAASLEVAQDRAAEKAFVERLGGRPAPWRAVSNRAELAAALDAIGTPAILKTRRFGYDGKGQARIMTPRDADAAWEAIGGQPAVLEGFVRFDHEFSVILCRDADGAVVTWPVPVNAHRDGILATSVVPAPPAVAAQAAEAVDLAGRVAAALDHVGVLCLEFFACADGPRFNEMAPRVHNSGHWTIEGALTSQFENQVRSVCGLPLGPTELVSAGARMDNLVGDAVDAWPVLLAEAGAHLHLYGKGASRPGRKMGHVTRLIRQRAPAKLSPK